MLSAEANKMAALLAVAERLISGMRGKREQREWLKGFYLHAKAGIWP